MYASKFFRFIDMLLYMCYFKLLLWLQGILCYLQVSSCQDLNGLYLQHILESECIHVDVGNHFSIAILGGIYK